MRAQVLKQSRTAAILVSYLPTATTGKGKMLQAANVTPLMATLETMYSRVTKFQTSNRADIGAASFEAYASIEKPLSSVRAWWPRVICVWACLFILCCAVLRCVVLCCVALFCIA